MPSLTPKPAAQGGLTAAQAGLIGDSVNQATHGFSVNDLIYQNPSDQTWAKAQADSAANAGAGGRLAFVDSVTDADNFIPRFGGPMTYTAHGFDVGAHVFMDNATAGAITDDVSGYSTDEVVVPVGTADDANTINVDFDSGYTVE